MAKKNFLLAKRFYSSETCERRDWQIRDPSWRIRDYTWRKSAESGGKMDFVGEIVLFILSTHTSWFMEFCWLWIRLGVASKKFLCWTLFIIISKDHCLINSLAWNQNIFQDENYSCSWWSKATWKVNQTFRLKPNLEMVLEYYYEPILLVVPCFFCQTMVDPCTVNVCLTYPLPSWLSRWFRSELCTYWNIMYIGNWLRRNFACCETQHSQSITAASLFKLNGLIIQVATDISLHRDSLAKLNYSAFSKLHIQAIHQDLELNST